MSSTNHDQNRDLQKDARAWAKFTGTNYSTALRQVASPFSQGLLGDRVSARQLINVLDSHALIGAKGGEPALGDNGYYSDEPWRFNGKTDFIELALVTDTLRMFAPTTAGMMPEVSSYRLKHTVEKFLAPLCPYVSNGKLIWAAAALGLDLVEPRDGGPNLLIGVSDREHDYVRRTVDAGRAQPGGHHHRPAGLEHLRDALARSAAGELFAGRWVRPTSTHVDAPFHEWLTAQAGRDDPLGDFASDYSAGVHDSDHRIARSPEELLSILYDVSPSPQVYDAGVAAIAEWLDAFPTSTPLRTELIASDSHESDGHGAGAGDVERCRYRCPCGMGEILEEHDNIPGHREHDVWIACEKCGDEWRLAVGRPVRAWGVLPVIARRES